MDVSFAEPVPGVHGGIDAAYHAKYELNDQISEAGLNDPRMPAPETVGQLTGRVVRGEVP